MPSRGWQIAWICLFLLALGLQIVAIHGQSLTGDGSYHLLAGHQALRYGQNRLNLEHPPLVKLVVALPLLAEAPIAPPIRVSTALVTASEIYRQPELLQRATIRARYLVLVLLVLPFFAACFFLGRRFGGPATGAVLLALVALSFDILPNLTILQTDTAVSLAFLLTLLAVLAFVERPGWHLALALGLAFGLGLASKYSAVLLGPVVLLAFVLAPGLGRQWLARLGQLGLAAAAALTVVYGTYALANRQYTSADGRHTLRSYCRNQGTLVVEDAMRRYERPLLDIERIEPYAAQWLAGFIGVRIQNELGVYPSYFFGEVSSQGRLAYFPVVLLVKTPLVLLVTGAALLVLGARRALRRSGSWRGIASSLRRTLPLWLTVGIYLGVAMGSNYNLGMRHLLPVLPVLYLPLAVALARRRQALAGVLAVLAVEVVILAPLWMSATNTWWLGRHNPTRLALSAGDLEYRQNFVQLARYVERHDLHPLHVLYPVLAEEVVRAYVPDARLMRPGLPLEPGWYAVNVIVEQYIPALLRASPESLWDYRGLHILALRWLPYWQAVATGQDHGYVAGTFRLYYLEAPVPVPSE